MPLDHRKHLPATATGTVVEALDIALSERLARGRRHPAMRALAGLSQVSDQGPLLALSGAVLLGGLVAGDRRAAGTGGRMLAAILAATAAKGLIKTLVSRTRPQRLLEDGQYEVRPLGPDSGPWHSFPSGHTAGGVAVARAVARSYPGARWPLYGAAAANGIVQVPTGAHYASDVVVGALVGLAAEAATERGRHAAAAWLRRDGGRRLPAWTGLRGRSPRD